MIDYNFLGGIITSGIIVTSVTTALFQFIAADLQKKWASAFESLDPIRRQVAELQDDRHLRDTNQLLEKFEELDEQTLNSSYIMRGFLFLLIFVFSLHQLLFLVGMRYYPSLLPYICGTLILSYVALLALLALAWFKQRAAQVECQNYAKSCKEELEKSSAVFAAEMNARNGN